MNRPEVPVWLKLLILGSAWGTGSGLGDCSGGAGQEAEVTSERRSTCVGEGECDLSEF